MILTGGKRMNEARDISLKISGQTKSISRSDLDRLDNLTYNGIEIRPKSDDIPMPWDAGVSVSSGNLEISGSVAGHGIGSCVVRIPLSKAASLYSFEVAADADDQEEAIAILKKYGWL